MIGPTYKVNTWGKWIHFLNFAALAWCAFGMWIIFPEVRQFFRDLQNAYYEIIKILEVING